MAVNIDPKFVVFGAMIIPVVYIAMKWEFTIFMLIGICVYGLYFFDKNFVDRSKLVKYKEPEIGPQKPFTPQEEDWVYNEENVPVKVPRPIAGQRRR